MDNRIPSDEPEDKKREYKLALRDRGWVLWMQKYTPDYGT